ncbi:MAG: type I DNA topoisomerase [Bacteroidia bacterium]|nr:type I DNA topoisomerase [Bacteroidia bacterium]MDW8345513.1 type I DNA topoisomerase [Bacteroidia bacterium]
MTKTLVIVESPAKAKSINKYLGSNYIVKASVGHIKDLPKNEQAIDKANGFKLNYEIIKGKKKVVDELKKVAGEVEKVLLATDPDREGEAIAWHIANEIQKKNKNISRVVFNEITKNAVLQAIQNPHSLDLDLVRAQEARRALDRLVGFEISPVLWKSLKYGLSAGRVQSVALEWIVNREIEIQNFKSQEYWTLEVIFTTQQKESYTARLYSVLNRIVGDDTEDKKKLRITDQAMIQRCINDIQKHTFVIDNITVKPRKTSPYPPFITSTLQQAASNVLKFTPKRTMTIAQQLYEGLDIGGETTGLITYMRTDSTRLSDEAIEAIRNYISQKYGQKYLPSQPNIFGKAKKGANIQDAHEAIRPTSMKNEPLIVKPYLTDEQFALYELIWNRTVACQMEAATDEITTVDTVSTDEKKTYLFRTTESRPVFEGYRVLWQHGADVQTDEENKEWSSKLPKNLKVRDAVVPEKFNPQQHFTKPPARYNPSSLVKALEDAGIGRPSTYATIIDVLQEREYVILKDRRFYPTDLGISVSKFLQERFDTFLNEELTQKMEAGLDEIAHGKEKYETFLQKFYDLLERAVKEAEQNKDKAGKVLIYLNNKEGNRIKCDKCETGYLVERWNRNGRFASCSNYPDCKNIKNINEKGEIYEPQKREVVPTAEKCHICGKNMLLKEGRFGKYYACIDYPKTCKGTRPYIDPNVETFNCPKCKIGVISEKKGKFGVFYPCNRYPDCDFTMKSKPIVQKCQNCECTLLEEKKNKKYGTQVICPLCKTIQE